MLGLFIQTTLSDIEPDLLDPLKAWDDLDQYHNIAKELVKKFQHNYQRYDLGDDAILDAGPKLPN